MHEFIIEKISGHHTHFHLIWQRLDGLSATIASGRCHHATTAASADICIGGLRGIDIPHVHTHRTHTHIEPTHIEHTPPSLCSRRLPRAYLSLPPDKEWQTKSIYLLHKLTKTWELGVASVLVHMIFDEEAWMHSRAKYCYGRILEMFCLSPLHSSSYIKNALPNRTLVVTQGHQKLHTC